MMMIIDDYLEGSGDAHRPLGKHDSHFNHDGSDANIFRPLFDFARDDCHFAISASTHSNCTYEIIYHCVTGAVLTHDVMYPEYFF